MGTFKGYIYVTLSGAVLLVATLFVVLQWGNPSDITAFGPLLHVRTIWLVLGSAAGGVVVYWSARLMVVGLRALAKARRHQREVEVKAESMVQAKAKADTPTEPPDSPDAD